MLPEDMTQCQTRRFCIHKSAGGPLLFVHHLTSNPPETRPEVQSSELKSGQKLLLLITVLELKRVMI